MGEHRGAGPSQGAGAPPMGHQGRSPCWEGVRMARRGMCAAHSVWHTPSQVTSDSDKGPGPLSGNPPSVAGCPG